MQNFIPRPVGLISLLLVSQLAHSRLCPSPLPPHPPEVLASQPLADAETPMSVACVYGLTTYSPGCKISQSKILPTGGWGAIAVVEGGDDPNAYAELTAFSIQYHLPILPLCPPSPTAADIPCFGTFYVNNTKPDGAADVGEHILDIEWAHAMAPFASIYMVEGPTLCVPEVLDTVDLASQLVANTGGGIVSNSWSVPEFPGEAFYDSHFQTPTVVYIASSGDNAYPARYPSASPYVISAGGTTVKRDSAGNFIKEIAWRNLNYPIGEKLSGVSGGPSLYESRPFFQNNVAKVVGDKRGTPDISFIADPRTGVSVYKTNCTDLLNNTGCTSGWTRSGGTSLAAPALAGVIDAANTRATTTTQELALIYAGAMKNYSSYWRDVTEGNNGYPAMAGYDFTTGLGTPLGYKGK